MIDWLVFYAVSAIFQPYNGERAWMLCVVTYLQDNLLGSYLVISRVWIELVNLLIYTDSLMIRVIIIKRPAKNIQIWPNLA